MKLRFPRALVACSVLTLALIGCSKGDHEHHQASSQAQTQVSSVVQQDAAVTAKNFVSVDGRQFKRNGEAYFIVGVNFWSAGYMGATGETGDRERLGKELDLLKANGVNNLRVLAMSEESELMRAVGPAIATKAGETSEELLAGLDYLLVEMAKRDMTVVLYLNNFWQWSGGMSQYVAWETNTEVFDPDKTGQWNEFMMNSAKFYSMPESQKLFQALIKKVVTRVNTISGVAYSEDPTIMSWQLANEPRPGSDEKGLENAEAYKTWIRSTAAYIKSLAPKQLLSTGSEGYMGSARNWELYKAAHDVPEVDYLTFHMWAKNWSWYDSTKAEETYPSALEKSLKYIDDHIDIANELNKPTVLEEFGLDRDLGSFEFDSTTVYRDKFFEAVFARLTDRAAKGDAIAGYNVWAWGGLGRTTRDDFMWQRGDDFMGDPPQEPQGLYSVFNTDVNTLNIMKTSAENFKKAAAK